ncbi:MAG: hypothetical protein AB7K71_21560 [Polyangiaceae bacterium]
MTKRGSRVAGSKRALGVGTSSAWLKSLSVGCVVATSVCFVGCAAEAGDEAEQGVEHTSAGQGLSKTLPGTGTTSGSTSGTSAGTSTGTVAPPSDPSSGGSGSKSGVDIGGTADTNAPPSYADQVMDQVPSTALPSGFENDLPLAPLNNYQVEEVASGNGWQEISVSGSSEDPETGAAKVLNDERLIIVRGESGVQNAPIGVTSVKAEILAEMDEMAPEVVGTATQLKTGAQYAQVTDVDTANQMVVDEPEPVYYLHKATLERMRQAELSGQAPPPGTMQLMGGCSDPIETKTFHKEFNFSKDLHKADESGAFTGTFDMHFGMGGFGIIELEYKRKRGGILGECVTYGFGFRKLLLNGQLWGDANVDLKGKLLKEWDYKKQVASPEIFKQVLWVGPVPVVVGLDVPIDMGIKASAAGDANFHSAVNGWGAFTSICTTSGCNTWTAAGINTSDLMPDFAVQANLKARPWAQAAVRAYLFDPSVAHAQVGVRPFVEAELHGYTGNQCGDGDHNGSNELVSSVSLEADAGFDITAEADLLGLLDWSDSWEIYRRHVYFNEIALAGLSSSAPMVWTEAPGASTSGGTTTTTSGGIRGIDIATTTTGSVSDGTTKPYARVIKIQMRPCWPYTDTMTYRIRIDGGAPFTWEHAPGSVLSLTPGFDTAGTHSVEVTALEDEHGREIGETVTRTFNIPQSGGTTTVPGPIFGGIKRR